MITSHNMIPAFGNIPLHKGTAIRGNNPPITIPNAADLRCGSSVAAIKSAITCANTTPKIPATYPLEIIFSNLLMLQPE